MNDTVRHGGYVSSDIAWMQYALGLARRHVGLTHPNPPVGCVIVSQGRRVGEGAHRKAGKPHAEVLALAAAGSRARGATLYVTLEPCSTWGRTGPCTEAILQAGVRRVVIASRDPNPKHNGRGILILRKAGIRVTEGVCRKDAMDLLAPFRKWISTGRPFVTVKLAMSLDGRIADLHGHSRWISGPASRRYVRNLRREVDAIMVGAETARLDDPQLRPAGSGRRAPCRIVVDSRGRLPLSSQVNRTSEAPTLLATTDRCPHATRKALQERGVDVWVVPARNKRVSLKHLMRRLGEKGLLHVLCEGGGEMAGALLREGMVDQLLIFLSPLVLGKEGRPVLGTASYPLRRALRVRFSRMDRVGDDFLLTILPAPRTRQREA